MRVLFVTGGSSATVFAIAPLATAMRNAGHQVIMAANDDLMAPITAIGIPAVSVSPLPIQHFVWSDRDGNQVRVPQDMREGLLHMGRSFARMGLAALDGLLALSEDWRPDLVVGGAMSLGAPLLAGKLGVPYVRHAWDTIALADLDQGAADELAAQGSPDVPPPELFVDICPPGLRAVQVPKSRPMRWVPGNQQCTLERWMYTRDVAGHRMLLTAGTRSFMPGNVPFLRRLTEALTRLDVEVLVAAPEDTAGRLRPDLGDVHIGWIPLDVVAPTCDLILHHGGGVTALTALNAGVPQLILAKGAYTLAAAQSLEQAGVGRLLPEEDQDDAESTVKACVDVLSDPDYRARARAMAEQNARQRRVADMADALEAIGARQAR
jgi:UDP:flavonoid glycosyltransferase YjiC (YdhE family)